MRKIRNRTARDWPDKEVSTRNCFNCLETGRAVRCRVGYSMIARNTRKQLSFHYVIRQPELATCCQSCKDFDNEW